MTPTTSPELGTAPGATREVIRTVELTKSYAGTDFKAVDGLNLVVEAGEIREFRKRVLS